MKKGKRFTGIYSMTTGCRQKFQKNHRLKEVVLIIIITFNGNDTNAPLKRNELFFVLTVVVVT